MTENQLSTVKPVYLAPPQVGVITNSSQTISSCGPFEIEAQFGDLTQDCDLYPRFVFLEINGEVRIQDGYGYGILLEGYGYGYGYGYGFPNGVSDVVLEITTPGDLTQETGSGIYTGEVVFVTDDGEYTTTQELTLEWVNGEWQVLGLAPFSIPIRLSNGSQYNPLMAQGDALYHQDGYTTSIQIRVLHFVPTDISGSGVEFFDCGNHIYGAEDPIPYSLKYTDSSIVDAEFEIIGPEGIFYTQGSNLGSGRFLLDWSPDQNGEFSIRVRGISEQRFYTRFGNAVKYQVNVAPPEIDFDIINEKIRCVPLYGDIVIVTETEHPFSYVLSPNCFGTKSVEFSLNNEQWRSTDFITGLFTIERLTPGIHYLRVRALDEAGQYSAESELSFFVSLSTHVTIDEYPEDPLCRPDATATIRGSKEANARIISIRGVKTETLRDLSPILWEAEIELIGNELQVIEVEVENIFGQRASAKQELFYKSRLPKVTVSELKATTFTSKAILRGRKDKSTALEVSLNNGPWTEVIPTDEEVTWQYLLELVSGFNKIRVRAIDAICGDIGEPVAVSTTYVDSTFISGVFQINNGAPLTGTTDVLLTFASTTASRIKVSNFEDFREGFVTDYRESLAWALLDFPGLKTVYVKFIDNSGIESIVFTNQILLTASTQISETEIQDHQVLGLNAVDILSGDPLGTIVVIRDARTGLYIVEIYLTPEAALEGASPVAVATTVDEGKQTLILYDTGTGSVNVEGTVEVTIVRGSKDVYIDRRKDIWSLTTGESVIPLQYKILEDGQFYYASLLLPYYESRFQGRVQNIVSIDETARTSVVAVDKVFLLLVAETADGYGYGEDKAFAQALSGAPTPLKEHFDTYPLTGMRFWYPTLPEYSSILMIEETDDAYFLTIDQILDNFDTGLAARIEFTKQNRDYIDYRINKQSGVMEFINESTYATGNVQVEYEYAEKSDGRPDENWYKLCTLKYNDDVVITIPQTVNRVTLAQLKRICVRFYNGNEGTAPSIVRFIINDNIIYEDRTSEVIEGPEGYGYRFDPIGYGYGYQMKPGVADQVVQFCVDNILDEEIIVNKIQLEFKATTPCMYIGEVVVNSETVPLDSNLQVILNGDIVFDSLKPVSNLFDRYEIRLEKGEADIWYNNDFVFNINLDDFNQTEITRFFGASARTANDSIDGQFLQIVDKKYYDDPTISVNLIGRYIGIEPNLRETDD